MADTDHDENGSAPVDFAGSKRLGFPLHALLNTVPMGVFAAATAFDVASLFTARPCSDFPRPAFWLIVVGLVSGAIAGFVGLFDLLKVPRESAAYKVGTRHVAATDIALVLFGASLVLRRGVDYCASVRPLPLVLSIAGSAVLLVGAALGLRLTYVHGLGVRRPEE